MGEISCTIRGLDVTVYCNGRPITNPFTNHITLCSEQIEIKKVIFNDPATIVYWNDGTKTVVKCQEGDIFDKEKGLAMAIIKKMYGNKGSYNKVFDKWIKE